MKGMLPGSHMMTRLHWMGLRMCSLWLITLDGWKQPETGDLSINQILFQEMLYSLPAEQWCHLA